MRNQYPSDISREEFEMIREELEKVNKKTYPTTYDLYDVFCAVLYLLKEGCTWRGLPHDFPKWQNVRYHYDKWAKADENGISTLDKILEKLVKKERKKRTTLLIVDSKTIQNVSTARMKGYDAGKKRSGIKLHIGVDILGLPHTILLTAADGGYTGQKLRWIVERSFGWLDQCRRFWKNCERSVHNFFQMVTLAGGAYQAVRYARQRQCRIINLIK